MKTETSVIATVAESSTIDPAVLADLEAVCAAKGVVRDPRLFQRITEHAERARKETLETFDVQTIGADILQTMHDE